MINGLSRRLVALLCMTGAMAACPVMAQDGTPSAREIASATYASVDRNGDGRVNRREMTGYSELGLLSADTNGDGKLSLEEFLGWDLGHLWLGDQRGRGAELRAAKTAMHRAWDANGDGFIDEAEHAGAISRDFVEADANADGVLTPAEFKQFRIVRTLEAALR